MAETLAFKPRSRAGYPAGLLKWLGVMLTLALFFGGPAAAEPSVRVLPNPLDRGTAGRVIVEGLASAMASELKADFAGRPVLFFPSGDRLLGFLAADVLLSPGSYELRLSWPGGTRTEEVKVRDRSYGVKKERAAAFSRLSPSERARLAREEKMLREVLATLSPRKLWSQSWLEPVAGRRQGQGFGRLSRVDGVLDPRPHEGVDYDLPVGAELRAPAAGRVLLAEPLLRTGGSLYIDHGLGLVSAYWYLSELKVQPGQLVEAGELLGLSGAGGPNEWPHLHYGLYLAGARVDPAHFHRLTAALPKAEGSGRPPASPEPQ